MNRKITALLLAGVILVLTAGILNAQERISPSKNYITRTLNDATQFTDISVIGIPDVIYTQKEGAPFVSIYCPENVYDMLDVNTANGTLTVKFKKNNIQFTGKCEIKVTASSSALKKVSITGTGDVKLKGLVKSDNLDVTISGTGDLEADNIVCTTMKSHVSGTGDIDIDRLECNEANLSVSGTGDIGIDYVKCETINARVSGTGDMEFKGVADNANLSVSGTGDISTKGLIAKSVTATAKGTGNIKCYASESIIAKISGLANIYYYGNPVSVTKEGKKNNIKAK